MRSEEETQVQMTTSVINSDPPGIRSTALYTAREAAAWLRLSNWKSVYEIAETELPRCKIGPSRGRIRYWGADLLCYVRGMPPLDMQTVIDAVRERITGPGTAVQAGIGMDPTRVM